MTASRVQRTALIQHMLLQKRKKLLLLLLLQSAVKPQVTTIPCRQYKKKRWWVHPCWKPRHQQGHFSTLMADMRTYDHAYFRNFVRMSPLLFDMLTNMMKDRIQRQHVVRECLSPAHRLAITLRFLATGDSYRSIAYAFRVGVTTVHNVVLDTCEALWDVLQPLYMPSPTTEIWRQSAKDYGKIWNFPGCCGAVDGRHMLIQQPAKSGSKFHNYKGTNSIVLMAVVDPAYSFLAVDVGGYGSQSDGSTFKSSAIGRALEGKNLGLPDVLTLPRSIIRTNHVLIGDEAFQLRPDFTRPYPGQGLDSKRRVFNYRLSRASRCSENAFGILALKWRVFRRTLAMKPENVDTTVKATLVLHNFLLKEEAMLSGNQRFYCPPGYADFTDSLGNIVPGQWAQNVADCALRPLAPTIARSFTVQAADVRNAYANYFWSPQGQVPWQWNLPGVVKPT